MGDKGEKGKKSVMGSMKKWFKRQIDEFDPVYVPPGQNP